MAWNWPWSAKKTPAVSAANVTELPWMKLAKAEIGVKEINGVRDEARVLAYFKDVGHPEIKHDETAWCAAFLGSMLVRAGQKSTGSLMAISYETYGLSVPDPIYGCIGVKRRKGSESWVRHTGFVAGANATTIFLLGGNTNDEVMIAAFPRIDFTAFRWPAGYPMVRLPMVTSLSAARDATEA